MKRDVIPTWITQHGFKYPQIKGDSLHFNLILFVHFKSNEQEYSQRNK